MAAARPGFKPATAESQVRRLNYYTARPHRGAVTCVCHAVGCWRGRRRNWWNWSSTSAGGRQSSTPRSPPSSVEYCASANSCIVTPATPLSLPPHHRFTAFPPFSGLFVPRIYRAKVAYSHRTFHPTFCWSVCPVHCGKTADWMRLGEVGWMGQGMM